MSGSLSADEVLRLAAVSDAADAVRTALAERDEQIRAAADAGLSLREIGRATGLSHVGVAKIVRRRST